MHKTNYRPTRSQQIAIAEMVRKVYYEENETIVVHHVLEDSFTRLYVQLELRRPGQVWFERVAL